MPGTTIGTQPREDPLPQSQLAAKNSTIIKIISIPKMPLATETEVLNLVDPRLETIGSQLTVQKGISSVAEPRVILVSGTTTRPLPATIL